MSRFILFLAALSLFAGSATAQPQSTQWFETTAVSVNGVSDQHIGQDVSTPEETSSTATDGTAGCTAGVSFGPPGPPQGTATLSAFAELGNADLTGTAQVTINFFARVIQTSTPPVTVTQVPVSFVASGTVEATGSTWIGTHAFSTITILAGGNNVLEGAVDASANPGSGFPSSDSFDVSNVVNVGIGENISGGMIALANVTAFGVDAGGGTSTAFVDPVIEVADEVIPGSSDSYRDHFEVEFGPGYYALGEPTPVQAVAWGKIKTLYR